ncbi:TetR family transcriptional regulator [Parahaliea mediterranea]|uniref:TetR/AcrR family transcriptional regulator n=1 Tax=Parahaliea mediterranea TaxID=651086 RepID=A0A939DGD8_9GAMM|nr:TetR/AcrR family transcriptional regulator [Parahaliea mediterranea]
MASITSCGSRYHHGDLRKALILASARLIEEEGLLGFSMVAAARRLGVSNAAPYRHFKDKNDLLNAVTDLAFFALGEEVERTARAPEHGAEDCIVALGMTYVDFLARHQPFYELMWGRLGRELSAQEQLATRASGFRFLIEALDHWRLHHGIHDCRVESIALAFWSMAHGLSVLQSHHAFTYYSADTDLETLLRHNTRIFLRGLACVSDPQPGA